jgi:glycosyltransferase involved in cell wall biosynthesis
LELKKICNLNIKQNYQVIYNTFNIEYKRLKYINVDFKSNFEELKDCEFILHVGSSLPRKNRDLLVKLLNLVKHKWDGKLCFAGQNINKSTLDLISEYKLEQKVVVIENPTFELLEILYNKCFVLIFPSFSEGFGWPLIEAQSIGCPVITSNIDPMLEITNGSALYADPNNEYSFEDKFYNLLEPSIRENLIQLGYMNINRFNKHKIIKEYIKFLEL